MIYIMPWAVEVAKRIDFLEIDASFKAVRPYNYCIFHGVNFNSSIPFAVSIFPTEKEDLYELLFDGLSHFMINSECFEGKHVLLDLGDAILLFSKRHMIVNHFCHRHIIEIFGSKSCFGIWVRKILKCKSRTEFLCVPDEVIAELNAYKEKMISMQEKQKNIDKIETKIKNLMIMLTLPEEIDDEVNEKNINIYESLYFMPKWAIWYMRNFHIPRCSNHSEGAHGNINR